MACLTPFLLKERLNDTMLVPCGKCPECLKSRASAWSFRLMQEMKTSWSGYFLTLTYDNNNVPISKNGFMSLSKGKSAHHKLFFKVLRRKHERAGFDYSDPGTPRIKYYLVGEYGGETYRPHYHLIVFNVKLELIIGKRNCDVIRIAGYDSKRHINDGHMWKKGYMTVGTVGEDSVGYALKYMTKKPFIGLHERDDRVKEFACMSKGLGLSYLTDQMKAWHYALPFERMYCNLTDGKKIGMPRYYKQKLYEDELRKEIGLESRKRMIERQYQEFVSLTNEQRENVLRSYNDRVALAFRQMYESAEQSRKNNF